jgi:hypothetical protein
MSEFINVVAATVAFFAVLGLAAWVGDQLL